MVRQWILDLKEDLRKAEESKDSKTRPAWILESSGHTKDLDKSWLAALDDSFQRDAIRESESFEFSKDKDLDGHPRRSEPISTSVPTRATGKPLFDEGGRFIGSQSQ